MHAGDDCEFGIPAEAKEAAAFALLAWMTWNRKAGNVPRGDGSGARGGAGVGDACVSCARTPTHRAIGQRDGWGTALCDGDAGPSTRVPCGNACSG